MTISMTGIPSNTPHLRDSENAIENRATYFVSGPLELFASLPCRASNSQIRGTKLVGGLKRTLDLGLNGMIRVDGHDTRPFT